MERIKKYVLNTLSLKQLTENPAEDKSAAGQEPQAKAGVRAGNINVSEVIDSILTSEPQDQIGAFGDSLGGKKVSEPKPVAGQHSERLRFYRKEVQEWPARWKKGQKNVVSWQPKEERASRKKEWSTVQLSGHEGKMSSQVPKSVI